MSIILEKFKKFNFINVVAFLLGVFLFVLLVWLIIQQFGIFQKQTIFPPEVIEIQRQVGVMKDSSVLKESKNLEKIVPPAEQIKILELSPGEIGKNTPFE